MLKSAIEKIEQMVKPEVFTSNGFTYLLGRDGGYQEVVPTLSLPQELTVHSLDALVQMIKHEGVEFNEKLFVDVPDHLTVQCCGPVDFDARATRTGWYRAIATDVPGWNESVKLPFDQAAVALQTRFQDSPDREYTLQLLSNITTGAKITYNDIGVATTVVTQKGVSLQQNQTIRPLVRLRPYRTFQEVEQPEGLFLIRIDERGITFTEADGGMWRLEARRTVLRYLQAALAQEIEDGSVVTML